MSTPAPRPCPRCGGRAHTGRLGVCARCLLGEGPATGAPDQIGGLELLDELGRGGMGTVYRARDRKLGRDVAVKFLPDELAARPELKARFLREARAMAALDHRGIVAIHDLREEDGQTFLVMELVEGSPLSKSIPVPPERALDVMAQVCDALAYAHARGVVHRDVKPENVLLDREGRAKVADFGIARMLREDRESALTGTGQIMGTPAYMAPEALAGAAADARMDVFSCGVLLYQLLTGKLPVGGLDPLPPAIERIVRRALQHEPAQRYRDAGEMRADLLRATQAGDTSSELPVDERMWIRAVALIGTAALGVTLWAGLVSVTPRVMRTDEVGPLVVLGLEPLGDGRVISRARFEVGPILGAVAALGLSFAAWAMLRRHWRTAGLHAITPDRALPESRRVFYVALVTLAAYGFRMVMEAFGSSWAPVYIPLIGGLLLVGVLHLFLETMLESQRTGRPLTREPLALGGMALALLPPVVEVIRFVTAWRP